MQSNPTPPPSDRNRFNHEMFNFALKWTPRTIVAGFSGYYSLGLFYKLGIMAKIDLFAIKILIHTVGYSGLGAAMPYVQWYSAWGMRAVTAISASFLYDLSERSVFKIIALVRTVDQQKKQLLNSSCPTKS